MTKQNSLDLRAPLSYGVIAGAVALSVSAIGMVELFAKRDLVSGWLTLGQVILFLATATLSYQAAKKAPTVQSWMMLLYGLVAGFVSGLPLVFFTLLTEAINLRQFLPHASPVLVDILTFNRETYVGSLILLGITSLIGVLASGFLLLPNRFSTPILTGVVGIFIIGMFSEILVERLRSFFGVEASNFIFRSRALRPNVTAVLLILISAIAYFWQLRGEKLKEYFATRSATQQSSFRWAGILILIIFGLFLPRLLGTYLSEVVNNVLIFALMGFGLNIVVGFAGLLDLGYVAFFAIGAYTMALLTSEGTLGIAGISFWAAIPICVAVAVLAGIMLGIPVLRMRGDYLAIVTLGFGEIIRILALSDLLKPYIGGAQGILKIPKPSVAGLDLIRPDQFYYVVLFGCLIAAFVSYRISGARLGRQWMAVREDEDVAEAMGIELVKTKLLAFAIGAAFAGLAGSIFASKLTSIFPHSFSLLVSIYVLCLIIVGGMGSLPGVAVGALVLIGLPELLREFAEYRMLMYGALLIAMMLAKPEGFWPSAVRQRELHAHQESGPSSTSMLEVE